METDKANSETLAASDEVGSENCVVVKDDISVLESEVCVQADIGGGVERDCDLGFEKGMTSGVGNIGAETCTAVVEENGAKKSESDGKLSEFRSSLKMVEENEDMEKNGEENGAQKSESDEDEDVGDQSWVYRVGDFVWGKIKSYPWWPGQIYDASDASEYALKIKQKDRFLVAYFGDGSFSWCSKSQIKPFVQNFKVLSEQSNSKNFVSAVEAALDEVSRIVELEMTCSCVAGDGRLKAAMASNSGIKEGVLVPVEGVGESFIAQCEPGSVIDGLKDFAETISVKNLLELTVLKSWLTAYYRAKGGYMLPLYHYPRCIEGLEDKSSNPVEIPVQGHDGEEWFSAPVIAVGSELNQFNQSLLQKCQEASGDILYQRRKQKSVSALIDDEMRKDPSFVDEPTTGKRKRKDDSEAEKQNSTLAALQSGLKRGRKKKATARSPRTLGKNITTGESNDFGGSDADETPPSRELKNKMLSGGESEAEEETARSNTTRERKRSKYLSPPFSNPSQIMRISSFKRDSETESVKNSRVGERMTRVAGQLIGFQNASNGTSQTGLSLEPGSSNTKSGSLNPKTAVHDHSKTDVSMDFNASPDQLLSQVLSAAVDPLCVIEKKEVENITEIIATFNNSVFRNSLNKVHQEGESSSKKRKSEDRSEQMRNGSYCQDLDMPPAKKAASACATRTNDEVEREAAAVALILTFPPAYSLPSRNELMKIYGKFGLMNDKETDVFHNSFCARVAYLRCSDGEEAYKASVEKNPFGAANVNYRLRYHSATAKASESNQKPSMDNATASPPSDDAAAQMGFIREKFKALTSMLESCEGRISVEVKSKLESDIKVLLEKVSSMTVISS